MEKICSQCKQKKALTEFYKAKNKPSGVAYCCKKCSDASNKRTRDRSTKQYFAYRKNNKLKITEQCDSYKIQRGCKICGEKSHPSVLEMHHPDPTVKENNPSQLRTSWKRWLSEAEKCIILCANCHRKVHAGIVSI